RTGAGRDRADEVADVEDRDAVPGGEIVAGHSARGPDRHVQAGGGVVARPRAGGDVGGGVGDDEDVGVLLGEGRVRVQLAGAVRDAPVDPVQAVAGAEGPDLGQGGAVPAAAREV